LLPDDASRSQRYDPPDLTDPLDPPDLTDVIDLTDLIDLMNPLAMNNPSSHD